MIEHRQAPCSTYKIGEGNKIKGKKLKYIAIVLIAITLLITVSIYTEFNGYPWEHARVKKEAVEYMKNKYNMDVKVVDSSFNFKFDYYTAKLYNVNDVDKSIIRVEKQRVYDESKQAWGNRLEDDYCKVYWEKRMNSEIREKYPEFCSHEDVEKIIVDISYSTTPLGEGISTERDEKGVFIPLKPELDGILDVDLKTRDFSEDFLEELLVLIREFNNAQMRVSLFITGKNEEVEAGNSTARTNLIDIEYDRFKDFQSVEDLRKAAKNF